MSTVLPSGSEPNTLRLLQQLSQKVEPPYSSLVQVDRSAASLSIKPRTQLSQKEMAVMMLAAMGVKPEELLTREAQTYPHRSYAIGDRSEACAESLTLALR